MKPKPSSGTGMLSAAGLSGGISGSGKLKPLLAPPPGVTGKIRTPLPPPPNDPAAARSSSSNHTTRRSNDPLSDLSSLEVCMKSLKDLYFTVPCPTFRLFSFSILKCRKIWHTGKLLT